MSVDVGDADRSPWLRGGVATLHAVLVVVVAFLGAAALASPLLSLITGLGVVTPETPAASAASTALQFLGFIAGTALYLTAIGKWDLVRDRVRLPGGRALLVTVGALLALYAVSLALGVVLSAAGLETAQNQVIQAGNEQPVLFLLMVPVTMLFVAPAEELLFRGVVQGLFRRAFGPAVAVAVASVLFGFAHWLALLGTDSASKLVYVLIAATLGVVLGAAYEYTENLTVPVLVHGGYNSLRFLAGYAAATGLV
jgi:membrane protease YdiL (CAAX protease family)